MPWSQDEGVRTLRLFYNLAVSSHASRLRKLTEATLSGESLSAVDVNAEAAARAHLDSVRQKLHAAMAATLAPSNYRSAARDPRDLQ
jgi:hypothetical protein